LANQTAVETDVIGRAYSDTENGRFTVDGDSAGADPLFNLAARSNTGAREDLLKSFAGFATPLASATADGLLIIGVMLLRRSCIVDLRGLGFRLDGRIAAPT
jgi:hypothetical protein